MANRGFIAGSQYKGQLSVTGESICTKYWLTALTLYYDVILTADRCSR